MKSFFKMFMSSVKQQNNCELFLVTLKKQKILVPSNTDMRVWYFCTIQHYFEPWLASKNLLFQCVKTKIMANDNWFDVLQSQLWNLSNLVDTTSREGVRRSVGESATTSLRGFESFDFEWLALCLDNVTNGKNVMQ